MKQILILLLIMYGLNNIVMAQSITNESSVAPSIMAQPIDEIQNVNIQLPQYKETGSLISFIGELASEVLARKLVSYSDSNTPFGPPYNQSIKNVPIKYSDFTICNKTYLYLQNVAEYRMNFGNL